MPFIFCIHLIFTFEQLDVETKNLHNTTEKYEKLVERREPLHLSVQELQIVFCWCIWYILVNFHEQNIVNIIL